MPKKITLVSTEFVEAIYEDGKLIETGKSKWDIHEGYIRELLEKLLKEKGTDIEDVYTEEGYNYEDMPKDIDEVILTNGRTIEVQRMIDEGMV